MAVQGRFFSNQVLTARSMGAFGASILSDGVLAGCGMSYSSVNRKITIASGFIIIGGRLIEIVEYEEVAVPPGATNGYVTVSIDLTKENIDDQIDIAFSSEIPSTSTDPDEINLSDGSQIYCGWIARFDSSNEGHEVSARSAGGSSGGLSRLWTRPSNIDTMAGSYEITSIPYDKYSIFYILFQRWPSYTGNQAGKSLYGQMFYVPRLQEELAMLETTYVPGSDSASQDGGLYYRADMVVPHDSTNTQRYTFHYSRGVMFYPSSGTIVFSDGYCWRSGYFADSVEIRNGAMVPVAVYGVS